MKQLKALLFGVQIEAIKGRTDCIVQGIAFDSRAIKPGDLFVAIKGDRIDGHRYIEQAIANGAAIVVGEVKPKQLPEDVVWVATKNSRAALAIMAANYYDRPSAKLKLIGVTGTNGKTTITSLLYNLFEQAGFATGLLSTIVVKYRSNEFTATHTTPDPLQINAHLNAMVNDGVEVCFMEVSSHGIAQDRINGLVFSGGVFTNLTHDHLDYHKSFSAYRDVKKAFFDALPKAAFALVNADDKNSSFLLQNCEAKQYSFGLNTYANFQAKVLETQFTGMLLSINQQEVWTTLVGQFNASNLLAVYAVAQLLDLDQIKTLSIISTLKNVKGRFQTYFTPNKATVIVDYAHTPDALENVLQTITKIRTKNETLITLVGCGRKSRSSKAT